MRPRIGLDVATVRENARAWRARAGVPLRAVVKSEGYGWGFSTMIDALEDLVDGFIVADMEEFEAVRPLTRRTVSILGEIPVDGLGCLLDAGALVNLTSPAGIQAAVAWARARGARARVRIGLRPAIGWVGFDEAELLANASLLAAPELEAELWTHLVRPDAFGEQRAAFARVEGILRRAGVRIVSTDLESTVPLASEHATGSFVRVGVGFFGARYGGELPGVRCALRAEALVVQSLPAAGRLVGYGGLRAPEDGYLLVVRCGYGDGFPRSSGTASKILSVGMQYTTLLQGNSSQAKSVMLLDADTDLDDLARAAGVAPHEIVVRLGHAARSRSHRLQESGS